LHGLTQINEYPVELYGIFTLSLIKLLTMQEKERAKFPNNTEASSSQSKQSSPTALPVGDLIIPKSEQIVTQAKTKKTRPAKSRTKQDNVNHKVSNSMADDKNALGDVAKSYKKLQKKRKTKERRKLKTFTRRLWGDEEDRAIAKLVKKYGIKKWTLISRKLQEEHQIYGRSGKQCRER